MSVEPDLDKLTARLRKAVGKLARGRRPVLAGPFTGEVGFELLYWIPLLRWAVREFPELRGRLIVVSRGGVDHWLSGLDARYVDLHSVAEPEELVAHRASFKQVEYTPFEREIVRRVRVRLGLPAVEVLHPSLLFGFYVHLRRSDPFAFVRAVSHSAEGCEGLAAVYQPLPEPELGPLESELPEDFVAVRFYFRASFPDEPEHRAFAHSAIEALAATTNVVLLNHDMALDDHRDFRFDSAAGSVTSLAQLVSPEDNLRIQTIAISRARAFVGTYGGLAYLPPFLGVPSLAFNALPEHTLPWHQYLAQRIFERPEWGGLMVLRPRDVQPLGMLAR
ncbi:MAG: hypothetical protein M3522_08265 [Actinomycetota bacterium]|nr:hypothetical protein [Actinomycetota bacterium]